jgi:D-amino-acid dehydrogenase
VQLNVANDNRNEFDLVVLGAGVVGINTAYWAQRAGLSVLVVDRQPDAGLETSFANGGQISVSHAEPWANPGAPLKVLKWLFDSDAPLLFRPRMDPQQWLWIARFLVDCLPHRADRHTVEIVKLALESRTLLQQIRAEEGLHYDERTRGILHFYRDAAEFEGAARVAELMRRHGCERRIVTADEVVALEPAFAANRHLIVGATYTAEDESGDAMKYTQALARLVVARGGRFLTGTEATALTLGRHGIEGVELRTPQGYRSIRAREVVVALGAHSAPFLRPYGISLRIYPAKGYSVTVPIAGRNGAPQVSLTDDQYKLVYSNLGDRLRIAGTAELSGWSRHLDQGRCQAILRNAQALFPNAADFSQPQFWTGLRPATPSNLPYVGATPHRGLWLNTGHGTLGWTMGAGSGKRVVDLITAGERALAA